MIVTINARWKRISEEHPFISYLSCERPILTLFIKFGHLLHWLQIEHRAQDDRLVKVFLEWLSISLPCYKYNSEKTSFELVSIGVNLDLRDSIVRFPMVILRAHIFVVDCNKNVYLNLVIVIFILGIYFRWIKRDLALVISFEVEDWVLGTVPAVIKLNFLI